MLSATSEYALRAMANLAPSIKGEPVLARKLSAEAGVSLTYLSKILGTLTKAGILQASRGRNGGYRLTRAAEQISLIDVVELFDGVKAKPDCLFGGGRECSDDNPCSAHEAFKRVRQEYIDFLETTTIADIAGPAYADGAPADGLPPAEAEGWK
ncbi:MAG: Rrf2 family transcriptional regulator [Nitrospinae bacterium]|nr:Rrf2 family transcriptional regulator [Nitrospinota bacterium]